MAIRTIVPVIFGFFAVQIAAQDEPGPGTCYFSNRARADGYLPCRPNEEVSECCPTNYSCYSSRVCVITDKSGANASSPIGTTFQAACTNPLWSNSECGTTCLNDDGGPMKACGGGKYCCALDLFNNNCDCASGKGTVGFVAGEFETAIGLHGNIITTIPAVPSSTATPSSATRNPSGTSTPSAAPTQASKKGGLSKGAKIGIGVGVGLGVIIIALLACLFGIRTYNRKKAQRNSRRQSVVPATTRRAVTPEENPADKTTVSFYQPLNSQQTLAQSLPRSGRTTPMTTFDTGGLTHATNLNGANRMPPRRAVSPPMHNPPMNLSPVPAPHQRFGGRFELPGERSQQ